MSASGTITAGAVQELLSALVKWRPESAGINARAGIPRSALDDPSQMIPLAAFTSMLEAAAYESGNRTLGLELGKEFNISALGPISHLMQTAQTVGDALESFNCFFESIQTSTRSVLSVSDGTARLVYSIQDPAIRFREQDAGFTLAIEYCMLASFLGPAWEASGVEFEHSAGDDLPFYQQHFACPLRFGRRENALLFPARFLNVSLKAADCNLHARLEADLADSIRHRSVRLDLVRGIEAWIAASLCRSADRYRGGRRRFRHEHPVVPAQARGPRHPLSRYSQPGPIAHRQMHAGGDQYSGDLDCSPTRIQRDQRVFARLQNSGWRDAC
jgi:hypothetical protein